MTQSFDTIVIGSGFGGAAAALRLAEKGDRVLVLERGRRWQVEDYPHKLDDAWIYDPDEPHKQNGWIDFRLFAKSKMGVAQGAGVGGGSLIYANISIEAPKEIFNQGWPAELTYAELAPHYLRVGEMLNVQELPDNQLTERFKLMREGAEKTGFGDRFQKLPLAVTFDREWNYDLEDPFDHSHSRTWTNAQGQEQGTCVHLGYCDLGCPVKAKNVLDLNYIPAAEKLGAEVRPLHVVRYLEPDKNGYKVYFDRIENGQLVPGSERAARVVIAAGSLGSTDLLLRCRDQYKTLTGLSRFLGHGWSSNGDFLTPAFYDDRRINPTEGPTITSAINFLDGAVDNEQFFIEDGGFPDLLEKYLDARGTDSGGRFAALRQALRKMREGRPPFSNVMPWFAQGIDAADGQFYLGRKWYAPWQRELKLDWDIQRSKGVIDAIVAMHKRLSAATSGKPWVPPTWEALELLVTPHPLGGCNMGTTVADGVVDHTGKVFGYDNLYVLDGAIIPEAIGRNPSRTIAALAERSIAMLES